MVAWHRWTFLGAAKSNSVLILHSFTTGHLMEVESQLFVSCHSLTTSALQYWIDPGPFRTPVHLQTLSAVILNCSVDVITSLTKMCLIYIYFFRFAARFEANCTAQDEWYEYSCRRRSSSGGCPCHCWCDYFCYLVEAKEKFFGWWVTLNSIPEMYHFTLWCLP